MILLVNASNYFVASEASSLAIANHTKNVFLQDYNVLLYAILGCAPLARNGASKAPFHANGPEAPCIQHIFTLITHPIA